jgi:thiamine biosynthesis lipoprotein
MHNATYGAFDVAVGALIKAWGFFRRKGRVPEASDLEAARARSGMSHVHLNTDEGTVHYDVPGLEINLGSVGKGYALDHVAALLSREFRITSGLVHGGKSSVLGLGAEPGTNRGWQVALKDPVRTKRTLGMFTLRNRALGISAATHQHLVHEGRRLGHVLDPRSGWPAEGVAVAAVTAPTAAEADALATAFYILGIDSTRRIIDDRPELGGVLMSDRESRLVVLGRAVEEFQPLR